MSETPIPVEVAGDNGVRLRGLEWPTPGPPVVFIHDFGADLDQWGSLTGGMAGAGHRVISLELSGHGLSDGDPDPASIAEDVRNAVVQASGVWGPVGLVVNGESARGAVGVGAAQGAPVQILISPPSLETGFLRSGEKAIRMIMTGGADQPGHSAAKRAHDHLRGQRMMMTVAGSAAAGIALATLRPSILEDMAQFFRYYLAPINMTWIRQKEAESAQEAETTAEDV